jgi:hypothetical protein
MTNAMFIALGYPLCYSHSDMRVRRQAIGAELLNSAVSGRIFFHAAPGVAIPKFQLPFAYPITNYWTGSRANDHERGFYPSKKAVLDLLPLQVRVRRRKYAHVKTEEKMENKFSKIPTLVGLENRAWDSLEDVVQGVEMRAESRGCRCPG